MGEIVLPPLISVEHYSEVDGRLAASIRWLIQRVFENLNDLPDKLRNGLARDDHGRLQVDYAVLTALTNGSLYCQAAAKIFKEAHLVSKSHGDVIAALTDYGIDVLQKPEDGWVKVEPADLIAMEPFQPMAHLAVIDALMLAHLRNVITVERVVDAVSRQTSVDDRERPMDSLDALLFWINKICLLLRDEVDRSDIQLKGGEDGGIPEMEDLYEEISDGQCLCALVAYYRPREMDIEEICFHDQMSVPDCQYNMTLLQDFCANYLPKNPFHFEVADLVYLPDSMQMNLNVFLSDLFDLFEPSPIAPPVPEVVQSPRRFVPINAIPELRAANQAARSPHPPRVRNPFSNVHVASSPARSMSMMSSDSLMTNRTQDSWAAANRLQQAPEQWGANVTNFGRLQQPDMGSNGNINSQYTRSDSLPAAAVRLALEEKRRQHEREKHIASTNADAERAEKAKTAFFSYMNQMKATDTHDDPHNKNNDAATARLLESLNQKLVSLEDKMAQMDAERSMSARMSRASSQPSVYQDMPATARADFSTGGTLPHGFAMNQAGGPFNQSFDQYQQQYVMNSQQTHYAQPQIRSSLSNGMLNYLPGQQPFDMMQMQQGYNPNVANGYQSAPPPPYPYGQMMPQMQAQQPGFSLMQQSAHSSTGFNMLQPTHAQPIGTAMNAQLPYGQSPQARSQYGSQTMLSHTDMYSNPMASHLTFGHEQQQSYGGTPVENVPPMGADGSFRLHAHDASSSRMDPPLELNRNLTNWSISMQGQAPTRPQRRQWENQTFIKSEKDLVNDPELVPVIDDSSYQQHRRSPSLVGTIKKSRDSTSRDSRDDFSDQLDRLHVSDPAPQVSQTSPPRDPSNNAIRSNGPAPLQEQRTSVASGGGAFVVSDDHQAAEDFDKIAEQRREAKRAAMLAKRIQRKEEADQQKKVDDNESRMREKIEAEQMKRDLAEQRKVEKEIRRQQILEQYKQKKAESEAAEVSSARGPSGRGSSQPPFVRTKSQVTESTMTMGRTPRARGASTVEQRVTMPASLNEPKTKLYGKVKIKSNRSLILNALSYAVFPGTVHEKEKQKAMNDVAASDSKHFLLLFRDQKCQYRGLYTWDEQSDTAEKISGQGPPKCREAMMKLMFKYDSGAKNFSIVPVKSLSATIDAFSIQDTYWQKPKIPHSTSGNVAAAHKNN